MFYHALKKLICSFPANVKPWYYIDFKMMIHVFLKTNYFYLWMYMFTYNRIYQCLSFRIKLDNLWNIFSKVRDTYQSSFNTHHQDKYVCFLIINTYCCSYLKLFSNVQWEYKYGSIQDKKRLQCSFKIIKFSVLMRSKENSQLEYTLQYQHF